MYLDDLLKYLLDTDTEVELWNGANFITCKEAHQLMDYFGDCMIDSYYPMTNGCLSVSINMNGMDVERILKAMEEDEGYMEAMKRDYESENYWTE